MIAFHYFDPLDLFGGLLMGDSYISGEVGDMAESKEFAIFQLIYPRSERSTLLFGLPLETTHNPDNQIICQEKYTRTAW